MRSSGMGNAVWRSLIQREAQNKRNIRILPKVPELLGIHRQVSARCILDGELVCIVDGKPDFSVIQRRSLLADKYKIELEAKRHPAVFIAFDCLYYDGQDLTMRPLTERREYLRQAVADSERLAVSRVYGADQAMELFQVTQAQGLEGIVAKRKDSLYIDKGDHLTSIVLGQYREKKLVYKGHVTLGVSGEAFAEVRSQPARVSLPFADPVPAGHGNEKAVWLEPRLVCTVEFMHRTKNGGMRQPVFKGLRWDKVPLECTEQSENQ